MFSCAWNIRDGSCVSYKLFDIPNTTPAISVGDEGYLRFYSQFYCEVLRHPTKGHDKFSIDARKLAFKNCKIREIEKWRAQRQEDLESRRLRGMSKIAAETQLNSLSVNDEWRDQETDIRRLKIAAETTEEDLADLYVGDDDEADDNAIDVDADIPADDQDDQQVIDTLDDQMMDDLAEARKKGVWVKKGATVKKEAGSRTWASRCRISQVRVFSQKLC